MPNTAKALLTTTVEYDPTITDPESIACAMDRLLKTVLSTPGVIEEYGDFKVGEFYSPLPCYAVYHIGTCEMLLATYGMSHSLAGMQACLEDADSRIVDDLTIVTILGIPEATDDDALETIEDDDEQEEDQDDVEHPQAGSPDHGG
jgi:hypothetical protein